MYLVTADAATEAFLHTQGDNGSGIEYHKNWYATQYGVDPASIAVGVLESIADIETSTAIISNGEVVGLLAIPPDFFVEVYCSDDGVNWVSEILDHDIAETVYFRVIATSGEQSVPGNWHGQTKMLPVYPEGSAVPINKPFVFNVAGDSMTGTAAWIVNSPTTYIFRPDDLVARFPGVYVDFITGNARMAVMG